MNILNSTLITFVKIRLVSHRKVDKRYLGGGGPPTPASLHAFHASSVHFRQTVFLLASKPKYFYAFACYPDYSKRTLACYCGACALERRHLCAARSR